MRKFVKLLTSISLVLTFLLLVPERSYISADSLESDGLNSGQVKVTITDDETGETSTLSQEYIKENLKVISTRSIGESQEVGYEVFIPIEEASTRDVDGSSKTTGGVTAKLYVDYDVNSTNEKVRLNKVYGSWVPGSMYYLTNRSVSAHSGVPYGKKISRTPSSNKFSYTTGWGYNLRIWGDSAPRAWSDAKINISGMTATKTIHVEFTYS